MTFTLSSTALSSRLQALARVLNSKNTLAILDSFLFEIADKSLTITASDGENVVISKLELTDSNENFSFCVSSKTIIDAVKEFAEEPLTFEINLDEMSATMTYHNGQNKLPIQVSESYPKLPMPDGDVHVITLEANKFEKAISRSIFATAQDDLRPVMNGLYIDLKSDNLTIVASDGHKLVRNENYDITGNEPAAFILPKKPATLLKSLLPKDGNVEIKFTQSNAVISFENYVLTCRLIEGRYPNYNSVIPQNNPNEVTVSRQSLLGALKRVLVFASQSSYLIRFSLEHNKLTLSSEDLDYSTSAKEELVCEYYGQTMSIGFKGTSMIEILGNLDCDDIILKLADPSRAGVVIPADKEDKDTVLMLLMPMLLND